MADSAECYKVGEICWLEIPVHDAARAQKLYSDIFGWECKPEAIPKGDHGVASLHFFSSKGNGVNGVFLLMEEGYEATKYGKLGKEVLLPPLPTFCVEECNATLEKVKNHAGETQCPKTEIGGNMGFYARFTDPEGNVIGIWSQK
ncbi:lactoylglutathione lyase family protein [Purpureocillium lilacinum]|uniref:Lactoylglutathione lyase family protein n=1 Tax=Purpureocillium lilacinum TaxID=33203 RepID=A0A179EXN1_PURLI|nr:lactoylglutathione lyase family protein [Purpureocillium lilacinum]OAQ57770.1 lactoylglutathione lyase family protein [Purpureocillium lilacinum]